MGRVRGEGVEFYHRLGAPAACDAQDQDGQQRESRANVQGVHTTSFPRAFFLFHHGSIQEVAANRVFTNAQGPAFSQALPMAKEEIKTASGQPLADQARR